MPACFLIAAAHSSALDSETNNWSLFSLIEQLQVTVSSQLPTLEGVVLPYEIHVFWELRPEEIDREFQFRLVSRQENEEKKSDAFTITSDKTRYRLRLVGLPIRFRGRSELLVEWRAGETDDWQRCSAYWPLEVDLLVDEAVRAPESTQ